MGQAHLEFKLELQYMKQDDRRGDANDSEMGPACPAEAFDETSAPQSSPSVTWAVEEERRLSDSEQGSVRRHDDKNNKVPSP